MTPGGRARGVWPRRVQNPFYTNIVILHINSKVMKSRIQSCKNFAQGAIGGVGGGGGGVTRGKKVGS